MGDITDIIKNELNGVLFIMMTYCSDVTCIKMSFLLY